MPAEGRINCETCGGSGEETVQTAVDDYQIIGPCPDCEGQQDTLVGRTIAAIDGLFAYLAKSGLVEEGGGLALHEQMKPLADARAELATEKRRDALDHLTQLSEELPGGYSGALAIPDQKRELSK